MNLYLDEVDSPLGAILVVTTEAGICGLEFADRRQRLERMLARRFGHYELTPRPGVHAAARRLREYFGGRLDALEDLPLDTAGTPFQQEVWSTLRSIPAGETRSYGDLAVTIGRPRAVRAVGAANGSNPIAIAVPCHRVVGSDGSLTGYAGGVDRKRWLLDHEGGPQSPRTASARRSTSSSVL